MNLSKQHSTMNTVLNISEDPRSQRLLKPQKVVRFQILNLPEL